jgi:hypothetical protein
MATYKRGHRHMSPSTETCRMMRARKTNAAAHACDGGFHPRNANAVDKVRPV